VPSPDRAEAQLVDRPRARQEVGLEAYYPWQDIEEYLEFRFKKGGYSFEQIKATGIIRGKPQPTTVEEGLELAFETPTKKIEFWSTALQKYNDEHGVTKGFEPVPVFTPPDEPPRGTYRLLFGRAPTHSFSRTQTNPILHDVMARERAVAQRGRGEAPGRQER